MSELLKSILTAALAIVITLTIQKMFMTPEPNINEQYYKSEIKRIDQELKQNREVFSNAIHQVNSRDERIKKDSIIIINSDRKYRDSIRNIINPR